MIPPMKISPEGVALIKKFEGCRLVAYQDVVGIWTIGVGHTGPDVYRGRTITEGEADALLRKDLISAEKCVNASVNTTLSQPEYDACVSLVFNVGCAAFRGSTLLRLINDDDPRASEQFLRWDHAGGKVIAGLTRRREAEKALFDTEVV